MDAESGPPVSAVLDVPPVVRARKPCLHDAGGRISLAVTPSKVFGGLAEWDARPTEALKKTVAIRIVMAEKVSLVHVDGIAERHIGQLGFPTQPRAAEGLPVPVDQLHHTIFQPRRAGALARERGLPGSGSQVAAPEDENG